MVEISSQQRWQHLFTDSGYIAKGLTAVESSPEADEFIEPATMSLEAAMQMLKKGEIIDAKTQLALLLAERCL